MSQLSDEMKAAISAKIFTQISNGKTVREAIDAVIGSGTAEKLIGEVYETLRAKGAREGSRLDFAQAQAEAATFPRVWIRVVRRNKRAGGVRYVAQLISRDHGTVIAACGEVETFEAAQARAHNWSASKRACYEARCYVLSHSEGI